MEEALKHWNSLFDDDSFNIWYSSPPKTAMVQVIFHNLLKQLQMLQKTFNENFTQQGSNDLSQSILKQIDNTPVKNTRNYDRTEALPKENLNISDVDSPDIFKDTSALSTSDSIFNRNVLNNDSPVPDLGTVVPPTFTSPTINRRKSCKKKKLSYPELNTTEKSMTQDTISTPSPQTSLINFSRNHTRTKNSEQELNHEENISVDIPQSKIGQNKAFQLPNVSGIRKRLNNLNSACLKTTIRHQTVVKQVNADKDTTLIFEDANKSSDATVLLTCPVATNVLPAQIDDSFLGLEKVRATKPIFLSKWEQKKLLEEDVDEQNCSRCGNFRGFQDLSPTMANTKDYKCPKHRKKYIRLNTPEAIWNLDFADEDSD